MRARLGAVLLAVVACAACGADARDADAPARDAGAVAEDAAARDTRPVYAVLLDSLRKSERRVLHVPTMTAPELGRGPRSDVVSGVTPAHLQAFRAANQQAVQIQRPPKVRGVKWVSPGQLDSLQATHPDRTLSVARLSAVGFSEDGRAALAYVSYWCGMRCGTSEWVLLERGAQGEWAVGRILAMAIH